ncbi:glycosyl hydrolase family 28 [Phlyctema vagabunda]|uniref:endo-polygalacturonase n=1 Tax=Phlyctema vagabunda TaxID=108571 RepID=A0ABR4PAE0_9HELO
MRSFYLLATLLPLALADACDGDYEAASSSSGVSSLLATGAVQVASSSAASSTTFSTVRLASKSTKKSTKTAASTRLVSSAIASSPTLAVSSIQSSQPAQSAAATAVSATGNACTVTAAAGIASAVASCTNIVLQDIAMPASQSLDLNDLQDGTTVTFAGKTTFGTTASSKFNPIEIAGTNIHITGATGHVIDGNGQAYWDGLGSNGGTDKPDHFIVLDKMVNSVVSNLNIQNWPTHCFDVTGCSGTTITGITLDNSAGDAPNSASGTKAAAHNSDGFDLSSCTDMVLSNSVVKNQDDCVAITSGSNITVTGMTCSGGHGLSIGSVGGKSNNVVSDITFADSSVSDSQNGCRIKSNSGTTGTIENITYKNIALSGISDYGIDVQQDYLNGGPTGEPTNGVKISGVSFTNVTGTATSDAINYYVLCGSGSCSDFTFTDVAISGGGDASSCNFPASGCPA